MKPLSLRLEEAEKLLLKGKEAEAKGEFELAYQCYTRAHDGILDCPRLHKVSHQHLRRVNWRIGNYAELATDVLVLLFAPLGVFELVSYFSKTEAYGADICKR